MTDFFFRLFDMSDFPRRWDCGEWSSGHGWLHVSSDLAIWSAYFAIPLVLLYFVRQRHDVPFLKVFWLFAAFILVCGITHLLEAVIFWYPIYRVAGLVKLTTAVVSWAAVVALIGVVPKALHLPSLAATNQRLEREIAHRAAGEHALQHLTARYEALLEGTRSIVWTTDADGAFVEPQESWQRFTGQAWEAHRGGGWVDALHPDDRRQVQQLWQAARTTRSAYHSVGRIWHADSHDYRHFEAEGVPVVDEDGNIYEWVGTVADVEQRWKLEDALRQSERRAANANQAKSEFLTNMSHEIRTPMSAILGYTDVLLGHLEDPDNRNCALIMKKNGHYLLDLINDILDLSRIEAGKLEIAPRDTSLPQLVADLCSLMRVRADEKGLSFRVRFDGAVPETVLVDATRLRQVLINLLGNAMKFTDVGHVALTVQFQPPGSASSFTRRAEATLQFSVVDTGIGISAEQQEHLFRPFSQGDASVTRSFGGSGLGLAISKRLVESMSGRLTVDSRVGVGSTFLLELPARVPAGTPMVQPEPDALVNSAPEPTAPLRSLNCRVLVVDDRRDVRHISQHFLETAGAIVGIAEDGQQAITAVQQAIQDGQPYDVILMDVQMPNVDGLQATAALRSLGVKSPIIALTADAMHGDREKCLDRGCDDYLSKPIDRVLLIEKVGHYASDVSVDELCAQRNRRAQTQQRPQQQTDPEEM